MQAHDHSYLDLSVLPRLRNHVLSPEVAVVFNKQLTSVLWSNAAGARLFGGRDIADLLIARLSHTQSFIKQLHGAVSQIEGANPLTRGLRIHQGIRSRLLQFEISPIDLPTDSEGILLTCDSRDVSQDAGETRLAEHAVAALEGFADAAAILDDFGLPLAASQNFSDLGLSEEVLGELVGELKNEDDRLIKRVVVNIAGNNIAAGLGRLADMPGRNLIVLAETDAAVIPADTAPGDTPQESDISAAPLHQDVKNTDTGFLSYPDQEADSIAGSEDSTSEMPDPEQDDVETVEYTQDDEAITSPPEVAALEPNILEQQHGSSSRSRSLLDRWFSRNEEPAEPNTDNALDKTGKTSGDLDREPKQPKGDFVFENDEEAVRFAWTIDENGVFQSISPELANTVGPNAADIVGRCWSDVARVFGFDHNGIIRELLEQRDTWSGKTVLWPVQGTDLVVPIELAALPLFGTGRKFEGFRGFGIIRTNDAVLDPDNTGLALVKEAAKDITQDAADQQIPAGPDDNDDDVDIILKPAMGEEERADSDGTTNVLKLVPRSFDDQENLDPATQKPVRSVDTSLLEKLPVSVLVYRTDAVLFANQQLLDATGYGSLLELEAAGGVGAIFKQIPPHDAGEAVHYNLIGKDGGHLDIHPFLHTVQWAGEKALMLSFIPQPDITDDNFPDHDSDKVTEIRNILDVASDGIIIMQPDGTIISLNASAEALFGYSDNEMPGQQFSTLFAPESRDGVDDYLQSLSSPGVTSLLNDGRDVIGQEANGGLIPMFVTISKMASTGKLCAVIRDMTNWKNTEEELVKSRRQAEDASEHKSDFLAHISHEIRTPLNAIIGFSEVMIEERFGPVENDRYREYLRDINRSGVHVLDLVNDLLDLSKIEAGKMELAFEAVDLNLVVSETVALLQPEANRNRIIIRTSLSRVVPKVVADTRSVRQIILNLVSNAIKFTPVNGQVIVSTVYENNGEVALRIRDTGSGMSETEIEEAMKPFQQINGASDKRGQGTGLGLPLTKALVEANKAYFDLESKPDSGTIAHVQFPTQRVLAD